MACYCSSSLSFFILALLTVLISPAISARDSSYIKPLVKVGSRSSITSYCQSWRLAVETNNAGTWNVTPSKCVSSIKTYYSGGQFDSDYDLVARYALAFAGKVKNRLDGKDAWVFDIDETLLSNFEYYNKAHGSPEDKGKTATQYKSEQRSKMVKKGYKLHGNTGDQWSDLQGFAVATRSFKVPNPLYYIA